jgi:hypothetical protein
MESLAKLVTIIGLSFTIVIESLIVFLIMRLFPNLGKWWFLVGPLSILLSFIVSILILKVIIYFNK